MKKNFKRILIDNIKTILWALLIAITIRSLFFQPFYIPSSSMESTLLIGDRIFVSKYSYGYSKHSFPFSPNIYNERIFYKKPKRGDLVVFKTPADNRTDYIKRLIGLPGDKIQFVNGDIMINGNAISRSKVQDTVLINCGRVSFEAITFEETLSNGIKYIASYNKKGTLQNTKVYDVPQNHFFLLGDNRDCSQDSRFLDNVGFVNKLNLIGKARVIFFSNDTTKGSVLKLWNLKKSFRFERLFKIIK